MQDYSDRAFLEFRRWVVQAVASLAAAIGLLVSPAAAQQAPRNSLEPGKIEKRVAPPAPLRRAVRPIAPAPLKAPAAEKPVRKFVLTGVEIVGATVYKADVFSDLYEGMLGREIGESEVVHLVEAITKIYRDGGYVLSRAVAEPQGLEFGVLRIRAIEGFVERLVVEGDMANDTGQLTAFGRKIIAEKPLRQSTLERYVLLMSDLPGVDVTPNLREPVTDSGAYELVLTTKRRPLSAFTNLDNRGTDPVGPYQFLLGTDINGVLGRNERTRLLAFVIPDNPHELRYYSLSHVEPIGSEGTLATLYGSRSKIDIYSESTGAPQRSDNRTVGMEFSHPFIRSQELDLYVDGVYEYIRSAQEALNDDFVDRIHALRIGSKLTFKDSLGGPSTIGFRLHKGLDILNASGVGDTNLSRTDGRSDFTKVTADLSRSQGLFDKFNLEFSATGQWSADVLLSNEEFGIGGSQYGRGYDPSELSGVHGVASVVELQYIVDTGQKYFNGLTLYGFYDVGLVWADDGESTPLTSAGAGARFTFFEGLIGSLEIAKPLNRDVAEKGDRDARMFFTVSAQF